jgi:hypothetical protein
MSINPRCLTSLLADARIYTIEAEFARRKQFVSRMDSTSSPQVSYVVYRMSHTGISAAPRGLPDIWLRTIVVLRSRPDFSAAGCLWPPFGRNDSENQSFLCVLRGKMKIRHRFTQIKQDKEGKDKSVKSV